MVSLFIVEIVRAGVGSDVLAELLVEALAEPLDDVLAELLLEALAEAGWAVASTFCTGRASVRAD
jgi:hypothetical protein